MRRNGRSSKEVARCKNTRRGGTKIRRNPLQDKELWRFSGHTPPLGGKRSWTELQNRRKPLQNKDLRQNPSNGASLNKLPLLWGQLKIIGGKFDFGTIVLYI